MGGRDACNEEGDRRRLGRLPFSNQIRNASDNVNADADRARLWLGLPQKPEVRGTLRVPKGASSDPTAVEATADGLPGAGMERVGYGNIPAEVVNVWEYR